jgi:chromosome condensin MukBEF ATPase and DNA-binding subunit MukB
MEKVDYLTEDSILPEDQKYLCISFLSDPDKKSTLSGIKVRGSFETYEKACEHAKKLQTVDPYFNVFVGEVGKWLAFDPNPDSEVVKDSEYANEELNNMMKNYLENQEKAKLFHEKRKNELLKKNVLDNITTINNNIDDTKEKIKNANYTEKENLKKNIQSYEEKINKLDKEKEDLDKQIKLINDDLEAFSNKNKIMPKIIN